MVWSVRGRSLEFCSCRLLCPCWLTADVEPDQGWCSGVLAFQVDEGASDGVDLAGGKVVATFDWPGNFWAGNGTGRLYIEQAADADQRRELEAIFGGQRGGPLGAVLPAVVTNMLPTQFTDIAIDWGEPTSLTVATVGEATLRPVKDQSGRSTTVASAAALTAFQMERMEVASSRGSRWQDPDLRSWDGDSGTMHKFDWAG
jgi:hypothetical protein